MNVEFVAAGLACSLGILTFFNILESRRWKRLVDKQRELIDAQNNALRERTASYEGYIANLKNEHAEALKANERQPQRAGHPRGFESC